MKPTGQHEGEESTRMMEKNEVIVVGTLGEKALGPKSHIVCKKRSITALTLQLTQKVKNCFRVRQSTSLRRSDRLPIHLAVRFAFSASVIASIRYLWIW